MLAIFSTNFIELTHDKAKTSYILKWMDWLLTHSARLGTPTTSLAHYGMHE
jgi:hypothetical protein